MIINVGEPNNYQEVLSYEKKKEQLNSMQQEMNFLYENHTYDLVKLLKGQVREL